MRTDNAAKRFVFLGSKKGLFDAPLPPGVTVCRDRAELEDVVNQALKRATLISLNRTFTDMLLERVIDLRLDLRGSNLLTLAPPRAESIPALLGLFHPVFGLVEGYRWLPGNELVAVLTRDDASERFIGGIVDPKARAITLLRGDRQTLVAPFALFAPSGDGTKPDFSKLGFADHGRTVVLGNYEASADASLYELDPAYRRVLNHQRRQTERSFGASLSRLRKQRRLKRSDFAPLSSKEIARLERNEIEKPQAKTLDVIAERLGVCREEIGSY